jgi:hypothetical protein
MVLGRDRDWLTRPLTLAFGRASGEPFERLGEAVRLGTGDGVLAFIVDHRYRLRKSSRMIPLARPVCLST